MARTDITQAAFPRQWQIPAVHGRGPGGAPFRYVGRFLRRIYSLLLEIHVSASSNVSVVRVLVWHGELPLFRRFCDPQAGLRGRLQAEKVSGNGVRWFCKASLLHLKLLSFCGRPQAPLHGGQALDGGGDSFLDHLPLLLHVLIIHGLSPTGGEAQHFALSPGWLLLLERKAVRPAQLGLGAGRAVWIGAGGCRLGAVFGCALRGHPRLSCHGG